MNHGFVIVPGSVSEERLDKLLCEIVRERWGDLVKVEHDGNYWNVSWGTDYSFGLSLWIETARKIEMRKQPGDLSSWLQIFIQSSLAARLKGKCADEGVSGRRWVGKPKEWWTFRQYWDEMHSGYDPTPEEKTISEACYARITAKAPKELLCTDESPPVRASRQSSPRSSRKTGSPRRSSSVAGR